MFCGFYLATIFRLKSGNKRNASSASAFIAILLPARDRNIERRRFTGDSAVRVDRGKLHIGRFLVLKIKLAHKLAFHQIGELIGQSFQALFVCPWQQMKIITQRKKIAGRLLCGRYCAFTASTRRNTWRSNVLNNQRTACWILALQRFQVLGEALADKRR
jgi:hypothetical protein